MMTWIIDKFAEMVNNDAYTETTGQEAKEIIAHEVEALGKLPSFVSNGDIVAFGCVWSTYTEEELKNDFGYLLDGDEEKEEELNMLIEKL